MLLVDILEKKREEDKSKDRRRWNSSFLDDLYEDKFEKKNTNEVNSDVDSSDQTDDSSQPKDTDGSDAPPDDSDDSLIDGDVDTLGVVGDNATESFNYALEWDEPITDKDIVHGIGGAVSKAAKTIGKGAMMAGAGAVAGAKALHDHYKRHEEFYDDKAAKLGKGLVKGAVAGAAGVSASVKALIRGGFTVSKFVEKKSLSVSRIDKKLNRLLNIVETLPKAKPMATFKNQRVAVGLKIGDNKDLRPSLSTLTKLLTRLEDYVRGPYVGQTLSITRDIDRVRRNENSFTAFTIEDQIAFKGFKIDNTIDNPKPNTVTYRYEDILPDDLRIVLVVPDPKTKDVHEIIEAYRESSAALVSDESMSSKYNELEHLSTDELKTFIHGLLSLTSMMRTTEKSISNISKQRGGMVKSFKNYLMTKSGLTKDKGAIEVLEAKSLFIDKVYIASVMRIENEVYNFLKGSLIYVESNIKELKSVRH